MACTNTSKADATVVTIECISDDELFPAMGVLSTISNMTMAYNISCPLIAVEGGKRKMVIDVEEMYHIVSQLPASPGRKAIFKIDAAEPDMIQMQIGPMAAFYKMPDERDPKIGPNSLSSLGVVKFKVLSNDLLTFIRFASGDYVGSTCKESEDLLWMEYDPKFKAVLINQGENYINSFQPAKQWIRECRNTSPEGFSVKQMAFDMIQELEPIKTTIDNACSVFKLRTFYSMVSHLEGKNIPLEVEFGNDVLCELKYTINGCTVRDYLAPVRMYSP
jgi:hypothetical protein